MIPKNIPGTACYGKLVLLGAPLDLGRSTIDPQQHQSRFPYKSACFWIRGLLPDICVSVLGCSYDTIRVRGPINGGDELIVLHRVTY